MINFLNFLLIKVDFLPYVRIFLINFFACYRSILTHFSKLFAIYDQLSIFGKSFTLFYTFRAIFKSIFHVFIIIIFRKSIRNYEVWLKNEWKLANNRWKSLVRETNKKKIAAKIKICKRWYFYKFFTQLSTIFNACFTNFCHLFIQFSVIFNEFWKSSNIVENLWKKHPSNLDDGTNSLEGDKKIFYKLWRIFGPVEVVFFFTNI